MLNFSNGAYMIQDVSELPNLIGGSSLFLDFETSSGNPKLDSLNPFWNCSVAGIGIAVDDSPAFYIPYQHFDDEDKNHISRWLHDIIEHCDYWINHNVKYDAHVAANCLQIVPACALVCTLTLSKLIDSDRILRGGYGLDALSLGWLKEDISQYEKALQPYLVRNKDYGRIPPDILGEYGAQDILTNRHLWQFILVNVPEESCTGATSVWNTEVALTFRLFEMEQRGMPIDPTELQIVQYKTLNRMLQIDEELTSLVGRSFRPRESGDCYDILCSQYGLPVLAYTKDTTTGEETNNPSFDKHALQMYLAQPHAPIPVIKLIQEYRQYDQFNNLFLTPWQTLHVNGRLHPIYNQCVRTGRLSCSDPNAQQLNDLAKRLIHPHEGYSIISMDASQIEFRFIAHYINDERAVAAFNENPDIDFHDWVAAQCGGIKRRPAKTVNFGIAFGEGKKKLIKQLAADTSLTERIRDEVEQMVATGQIAADEQSAYFATLATQLGTNVYNTYHRTFPTLKPTMKDVEKVLRARGYVRNMYGRRRHLPYDKAYRGFNTLNQSSAADWMKARTVGICDMIQNTSIEFIASVHDEFVFQAPTEVAEDWRTKRDMVAYMETLDIPLRVPVRVAYGTSANNWKDAGEKVKDGGNNTTLQYDPAEAKALDHLR